MDYQEMVEYLQNFKPQKPRNFMVHIDFCITALRYLKKAGFTYERLWARNGQKANSFNLFIDHRHVATLYVILYRNEYSEFLKDDLWEIKTKDWDIRQQSPITLKDREYVSSQLFRYNFGYNGFKPKPPYPLV